MEELTKAYYPFYTKRDVGIVSSYAIIKKMMKDYPYENYPIEFRKFNTREQAVEFLTKVVGEVFMKNSGLATATADTYIVQRYGYIAVRTVNGGGVFSNEDKLLEAVSKKDILERERCRFYKDALKFAFGRPFPIGDENTFKRINKEYIFPAHIVKK